MPPKEKPVLTPKTTKTNKKQPLAAEVEVQQRQEEMGLINKKLAQPQVELEAAYRQYTDLYDFAPVGYFTLARNGAIHQVNLAGADLLGVKHDEVTRIRLAAFVSRESRSAFKVFFEKLLSGNGKETCELALERKGKGLFWARLEATCFEGGDVCRAMLTDITERKRMSSLLQARVRISEFAESHTFDELLQKTLDEAEALTGSQIGFAHFLEADQKTLQLQMWSTNTLSNMCTAEGKGRHYPVDEAGVWADCVYTHAPVIHNDYANLPASRRKGLPPGHVAVLRELVAPVVRNDLIVMIMSVGNKSTDYDDNDVEALSQLADSAWDIIQRKQAEELLKESEWRHRIVSELTTDYIFVVDVDPSGILKFHWASDNLFRMTGRKIEEVATSDVWGNIIHPDDRGRFFGFTNQILSTAEAGELECRTFHKQGRERWVRIFVRPQVDEGNRVTTIVGAIQDITERKQAETLLEKSRNLLAETEKMGNVGGWEFDIDTKEQIWTDEVYRIHEVDVTYKPTVDKGINFYTSASRPIIEQAVQRVIEHGKPFDMEMEIITAKGNLRSVHVIGKANMERRRVFGFFQDITKRVRAEQALRESESLYRKMNENSPLGMHFYNLTNNNQLIFVDANPAADKLLGVDNSKFIGKTIEEAFPPLIQTEVPERYRNAAAKGIPWSTEQIAYEDRWIKGAFEVRAFQTSPGNMVAVFADITQRKLAEQALEAANRELQTALTLQQQLAHTDSLTGINNRRRLYELAEHEFEIATRYQQPLSVIMFDLDHFKEVNDIFGHTVGDSVLQRVTQVACAELRSADVIGRYGGEEFVIILPMTNAKKAYPLAERIRAGVAAMRVSTEKGDAVVTLSIGIVEMTHDAQTESIEAMIHNADEAMYAAKQAGRNRTKIGD